MKPIRNMEELRIAQRDVEHRLEIKEMQLQGYVRSLREMLSPAYYINYAVSKVTVLERLVDSFYRGYRMVADFIAEHRRKKGQPQETEPEAPQSESGSEAAETESATAEPAAGTTEPAIGE